jgi:serine/threonine protein kinase
MGTQDYFRKMTLYQVQQYMKALFESLAHLHRNGVIHRDIKPSNFLYDYDRHCRSIKAAETAASSLSSSTTTSMERKASRQRRASLDTNNESLFNEANDEEFYSLVDFGLAVAAPVGCDDPQFYDRQWYQPHVDFWPGDDIDDKEDAQLNDEELQLKLIRTRQRLHQLKAKAPPLPVVSKVARAKTKKATASTTNSNKTQLSSTISTSSGVPSSSSSNRAAKRKAIETSPSSSSTSTLVTVNESPTIRASKTIRTSSTNGVAVTAPTISIPTAPTTPKRSSLTTNTGNNGRTLPMASPKSSPKGHLNVLNRSTTTITPNMNSGNGFIATKPLPASSLPLTNQTFFRSSSTIARSPVRAVMTSSSTTTAATSLLRRETSHKLAQLVAADKAKRAIRKQV